MRRAYLDLLFGSLMLVLLGMIWWVIIPIGIVVPKSIDSAALSPDFWPKIVVLIASIASFFVLLEAWRDIGRPEAEGGTELDGDIYYPMLQAASRVAAVPIGILVVYFAIAISGIVAGCMILLAVLIRLAGEKRWWLVVLNAVVLPMLLYWFFTYLANIPLPLGLFEQFR